MESSVSMSLVNASLRMLSRSHLLNMYCQQLDFKSAQLDADTAFFSA